MADIVRLKLKPLHGLHEELPAMRPVVTYWMAHMNSSDSELLRSDSFVYAPSAVTDRSRLNIELVVCSVTVSESTASTPV
jgi:hypothetical protein